MALGFSEKPCLQIMFRFLDNNEMAEGLLDKANQLISFMLFSIKDMAFGLYIKAVHKIREGFCSNREIAAGFTDNQNLSIFSRGTQCNNDIFL